MDKKIRAIVADAAIAAAAVAAYSPGLLNLRPGDPSIFRAGMSLLLPVIFAFVFVKFNILDLREPVIEQGRGNTAEEVTRELEVLRDRVSFKEMIDEAIRQIARAENDRKKLAELVGSRFSEQFEDWQRYTEAVTRGCDSVIENAQSMGVSIANFDEKGYLELRNRVVTGAYKEDAVPDSLQEQRLKDYEKQRAEIGAVLALNESMLTKMEALAGAVGGIDVNKKAGETVKIRQDIEQLIADVRR